MRHQRGAGGGVDGRWLGLLAYVSRPGPRMVEGREILAQALHPDLFPRPAPRAPARARRAYYHRDSMRRNAFTARSKPHRE